MNDITAKNIYDEIPKVSDVEFFQEIVKTKELKIERIVSQGHISPPGYWYDQEKNEFVLLLSGSAIIKFDDNSLVKLKEGDYLIIPAHKKHRVEETDKDQKTFWLSVFY